MLQLSQRRVQSSCGDKTNMPNVLKFPQLGLAPPGRIYTASRDAETEGLLDRRHQPTNARHDIGNIILCLEVAALQLRRADAIKSETDQIRTASEHLLMAAELIEIVRRKAMRIESRGLVAL